jgi:hypothetical protein
MSNIFDNVLGQTVAFELPMRIEAMTPTAPK